MKKANLNFPFMEMIKLGISLTLGSVSVWLLICIYTLTFLGIGYYLLVNFNKENTDLLEELQLGQYIGIILCIFGLLPFFQYFFMGFLLEGGKALAEEVF
jgi:uncharacterized membrane protein (Fun14 family)